MNFLVRDQPIRKKTIKSEPANPLDFSDNKHGSTDNRRDVADTITIMLGGVFPLETGRVFWLAPTPLFLIRPTRLFAT